jgi:hypothetical protein
MSSTTGILAFDTTNNHYRKLVCNTSGELKVEQSGSPTLPTGASTLTEQQSQTTHLATLANTVNAGGEQKVSVSSENFGTHNNLANNITLNAGATTSSLNISEIAFGNLFYEDSTTSSTEGLEIEVSVDNTNWYSWGVILPYTSGAVRKENVPNASAHGIRYIRLKNLSSTVNYTNVNATITGSH